MLFKTDEITKAIDLLTRAEIEHILNVAKYENKKAGDGRDLEAIELSFQKKQEQRLKNIKYLQGLRARIQEKPSEKTLLSLLKEIEGIKIKTGFATVTTDDLLSTYQPTTIHRKRDEWTSPANVQLFLEKKANGEKISRTLVHLKIIHDRLNTQLKSLRSAKTMNGTHILGQPDKVGKISSPAINEFIDDSIASNRETFPDGEPTALMDFARCGILINGKRFLNIGTKDLYKVVREFLGSSVKISRNTNELNALCNMILKNGQSLKSLFINEYDLKDPSEYLLRYEDQYYLIGQNNYLANWTLDDKGELCLEIQLDCKSIAPLTGPGMVPLILDAETGKIRELDSPKDDYGNFPTIIKYTASISFDISKSEPAYKSADFFQANKGRPTETLATPVVNSFEVIIYNDKVHYKPTLTSYAELEVMKPLSQ